MSDLIKPKDIECTSVDGDVITYRISRFPATDAREIITGYLKAATPNSGDYNASKALMKKLMSYVAAINANGDEIRLRSESLINNHVPDFDTLATIEHQTLEYNSNFFNIGKISQSLNQFEGMVKQLITKTSTHSSEQSSAKAEQPSTS